MRFNNMTIKSKTNRTYRSSLFLAVALLTGGFAGIQTMTTVHAAAVQFASVDLQKVFAQSKAKAAADIELQKLGQSLQTAFQAQQSAQMLAPSDLKQLGTLILKPVPTVADTQSIADLEAKAKTANDSLVALQQMKDSELTQQNRLDLATLSAQAQAGQQALSDINTDYRQQLDARSQELNTQINAQMRVVIGQVAQAKGVAVVFDSAVAVYTQLDLTNDVTTAMNK